MDGHMDGYKTWLIAVQRFKYYSKSQDKKNFYKIMSGKACRQLVV